MKLLETRWGHHLLHNATRIDCYIEEFEDKYKLYLCIDGYKHKIMNFENRRDANFVCGLLNTDLYEFLLDKKKDSAYLDDMLKPHLNYIMSAEYKKGSNDE